MGNNSEHNNVLQNRWPERKEQELSLRTDVEKIILHLRGELPNTKLSPALEEKMRRLKRASELIEKYGGMKKVIPVLQELYDISFATARRLYIEAQEAYGAVTHFNKQFHIDTYIQMLLEGANQAKAAGDFRSYSTMMDRYKDAIKEFMGTTDEEMYKQIQIPPFQVGFFPEVLKTKLPNNLEARIAKLRQERANQEIEDAIVLEPEQDEEDPL
jgi:hypothetical protein